VASKKLNLEQHLLCHSLQHRQSAMREHHTLQNAAQHHTMQGGKADTQDSESEIEDATANDFRADA
jgi:hypothetical protein